MQGLSRQAKHIMLLFLLLTRFKKHFKGALQRCGKWCPSGALQFGDLIQICGRSLRRSREGIYEMAERPWSPADALKSLCFVI